MPDPSPHATTLHARDVVYDLIPKLKTTERLVDSTLQGRIERCADAAEKAKLEELKIEFELEISMIHMNLKHLMRRYSKQLEEAARDDASGDSTLLTLDDHEAVAIESARTLYQRAQALAT